MKVKNAISKVFKDRQQLSDTSNKPRDHKYLSNEKKKVVGKFKDACAGKISGFVGLHVKTYSYTIVATNVKKATGVM